MVLVVWLLRLSLRSKKKKEKGTFDDVVYKPLNVPSSSDPEPEKRTTKSKK